MKSEYFCGHEKADYNKKPFW